MKKHFFHTFLKSVLPVFTAGVILVAIVRVVVYFYGMLSCDWYNLCEPPGRFFYFFEFPMLILLGLLFYVPDKKTARNILSALAATLPAVACYVVFDAFYILRHRAMSFSDVREMRMLWDFSPLMAAGLLTIIAVAVIPSILLGARQVRLNGFSAGRMALKSVMVVIMIFLIFNSFVLVPFQSRFLLFVDWSDSLNVNANGRLASMIYYENKCNSTARTLALYHKGKVQNPLAKVKTGWKKRNVHIVVLESFMDPRHLRGVSFSRDPLYEKIPVLLGNSWFSVAMSPIYGGGTPQAEFEILCGVPALRKIESIEFNVFNGRKVKSLVNTLKAYGYSSVASIASEPTLYNSNLAYRTLGFDELHFVGADDVYRKLDKGYYIFDGDLLDQNLELIQSSYIRRGRPVINYVLGMFGHLPYKRDRERFPDVLTVSVNGQPCDTVNELSNQFYYRTKAVYHYLAKLRLIDPDGIVLVVADHLPPLLHEDFRYSMDEHDNIFVLFNGPTRYTRAEDFPYFHFPYLIMRLLSGSPVSVPDRQRLEELYFDILATGNGME